MWLPHPRRILCRHRLVRALCHHVPESPPRPCAVPARPRHHARWHHARTTAAPTPAPGASRHRHIDLNWFALPRRHARVALRVLLYVVYHVSCWGGVARNWRNGQWRAMSLTRHCAAPGRAVWREHAYEIGRVRVPAQRQKIKHLRRASEGPKCRTMCHARGCVGVWGVWGVLGSPGASQLPLTKGPKRWKF